MSLDEFGDNLTAFKSYMASTLKEDALISAFDLSALIKVRVLQGVNASGGVFTPYDPIYAEKRRKAGRQTQRKVYDFEGNLHADFNPLVVSEEQDKITVDLTVKSDINQLKAQVHSDREGEFIFQPNEEEINIAQQLFSERRIQKATAFFE